MLWGTGAVDDGVRTVARKFSIGGLDILKCDKNSTDYTGFHSFWGLGALFRGGLSLRGDGTGWMSGYLMEGALFPFRRLLGSTIKK